MAGSKDTKIFEKYNPKSDVVRCPYGRSSVRKLLDSYTMAAVNLYGIIRREDVVSIYNRQNIDQTTVEELYILLLPLVLKDSWYGFYKEYIVHYWFLGDFEQADNLLSHQADKPRYIPDKSEFLKYVNEDYEDNRQWWNVLSFMRDNFGYSRDTGEAYEEVRHYMTYNTGIGELGSILKKYNLIFNGREQLQDFINLIMSAKNNTRIWENNGHTPYELHGILSERNKNIINFPTTKRKKIGRNDPCPCGSGKKYKKCCAILENTKTAQLSPEECRDFYETWYGLMGFVNEKLNVVNVKIKPEYPNAVSDVIIHKVREVLWENPELIEEYISEINLEQEKIDILGLWREKYKKGTFFILEYLPEYAIAIAANEQGEDRLYGIKGISNPIANTMTRDLPIQLETVLLPFRGKIVYDSFMSTMSIGFGEGAKKAFREMYDKAKKHGIITSLD